MLRSTSSNSFLWNSDIPTKWNTCMHTCLISNLGALRVKPLISQPCKFWNIPRSPGQASKSSLQNALQREPNPVYVWVVIWGLKLVFPIVQYYCYLLSHCILSLINLSCRPYMGLNVGLELLLLRLLRQGYKPLAILYFSYFDHRLVPHYITITTRIMASRR